MKRKLSLILTVAGFAAAGPLFAHTMSSSGGVVPLSHLHPTYEEASRFYRLYEDSTHDTITVLWIAKKACPNGTTLMQEYDVTITRTQAKAATYSLWSLGLQNAGGLTEISIPNPGQLRIAESTYHPLRMAGTSEKVTAAGLVTSPVGSIVDDKQIWLAEFTGTSFTFTVKCYGRLGETRWSPTVFICDQDGNGHDNTPP